MGAFFFSCVPNYNIDAIVDESSNIYPDYKDVTIPCNIAPLNFEVKNIKSGFVVLTANNKPYYFDIKDGNVSFDLKKWHKIIGENKGQSISFQIAAQKNGKYLGYKAFNIHISKDSIDQYIVYRLIEPGYELWNNMGIYQRNLQNFDQTAVYENSLSNQNCVNCHSFQSNSPNRMLFHMRSSNSGTYIIDDGKIEKLRLNSKDKIKSLVYPYWHPSGKYIAFSSNDTRQAFHFNDPNKIEVYDLSSNIVVYDYKNNRLISSPYLLSENSFQTFPTFSPDGKWLYFCTAEAQNMPKSYKKVHYNICRIGFDDEKGDFDNKIDTIFNANNEMSASFPRISPDGKFLLFTKFNYGNFSIWHKEADLEMVNLENQNTLPLNLWNSDDTESYHSWSSNGKWVVYSSRRDDGLYTRLYIGHVDENGSVQKSFLLPQKNNNIYRELMKSYNIPEFIKERVKLNTYQLINEPKEVIPKNL